MFYSIAMTGKVRIIMSKGIHTIRELIEEREKQILSPKAQLSSKSRGRLKEEPPCPVRPAYQHDRDRILHSKAFRRLQYKTQVLLLPKGDHYRTRLTHTLEVTQIARTIARALRLNEDLTEAIALGHDLGHTPFGHAGEETLNKLVKGGFSHYKQSLRVVDELERNGEGLNLTYEVRDGILKHSKGKGPIISKNPEFQAETLEGRVVRIADIIAYLNHDLDDALRAGVLKEEKIPKECVKILGSRYSERIHTMVTDVIFETSKHDDLNIYISDRVYEAMNKLRDFLFKNVYEVETVRAEFRKCSKILEALFEYYMEHPDVFEKDSGGARRDDPYEQRVCDFIAGMTDRYAFYRYEQIFMPKPWDVF